jgi:hypothetical protein
LVVCGDADDDDADDADLADKVGHCSIAVLLLDIHEGY